MSFWQKNSTEKDELVINFNAAVKYSEQMQQRHS